MTHTTDDNGAPSAPRRIGAHHLRVALIRDMETGEILGHVGCDDHPVIAWWRVRALLRQGLGLTWQQVLVTEIVTTTFWVKWFCAGLAVLAVVRACHG